MPDSCECSVPVFLDDDTCAICKLLIPEEADEFDDLPPSCIICGCTDEDCSQCIADTGQPCSWVPLPGVDLAICDRCLLYAVRLNELFSRFAEEATKAGVVFHVKILNADYPTLGSSRRKWQVIRRDETFIGESLTEALEACHAAAQRGEQ